MSTIAFLLVVLTVAFLVAGQVILKHAMGMTHTTPMPWKKFIPKFALGIGMMTAWFFLWLSLLQSYDLSYLFPFDALSAVLLSLAAMVFLKEKLTLRLCVGVVLIVIGVMFVSAS